MDRGEGHRHKRLPRVSTRSSQTESYTADDPARYLPKECSYSFIATPTDPYYDKADPYTPHDPSFLHRPTRYTLDLASPFANAREPKPYYETQDDHYPPKQYHFDWHDTYRYAYFDRQWRALRMFSMRLRKCATSEIFVAPSEVFTRQKQTSFNRRTSAYHYFCRIRITTLVSVAQASYL